MGTIKDFYGGESGSRVYLDIYSENNNTAERNVHRRLTDQDAYDTWHLADLFKEIVACEEIFDKKVVEFEEIPRKEKNLIMYLLLLQMDFYPLTIWELGSSLFELIDGLKLVERYYNQLNKQNYYVTDNKFRGIEISQLLARASIKLHADMDIKIFDDLEGIKGNFDILYDRNVSSYVFADAASLCRFINLFQVCYMNLFVSKGETFSHLRLGKHHTYFSLSEIVQLTDKKIFHLFGEKAPNPFSRDEKYRDSVIEGFFLICEPEIAEKFYCNSIKNKDIIQYFLEKKINMKPADILL